MKTVTMTVTAIVIVLLIVWKAPMEKTQDLTAVNQERKDCINPLVAKINVYFLLLRLSKVKHCLIFSYF
jgi:hypothetical protein